MSGLFITLEGPEDRPHRVDVLAQARDGVRELRREPSDDVRLHLRAEPELEVAARLVGEVPRDLGGHHRAAGERDGHRGAHADPSVRGVGRHRARKVRVVSRLGEPHRVETELFGAARESGDIAETAPDSGITHLYE